MSCILKDSRKRSPYWIASFTAADGRRLKRSTKTTDSKLAKRLAAEWEAAGKAGRAGRLVEAQCEGVARKLRLVAKVLEGKPIGAKYDDAYREAYDKALRTGNRKHERPLDPDREKRGYPLLPFPSEVYDKLPVVLSNRGLRKTPTERAARRKKRSRGD